MTWFSLPITQPDRKAAFADAAGAATWLSGQPQTNAPAMQAELARQIQSLNAYRMAPSERFATLEALRKTIFAVDGECRRRFENRALPLAPAEQGALDTSRRLWRACAVGYLHCLRACLDHETGVAELAARIAHRALVSLRMEQTSCYLGGREVDAEIWRNLHAILASAEQLGVARDPVADRLLEETSESTINGQYAMSLLLHLSRPFELNRVQFSAVTRWLARWREQAAILSEAEEGAKSRSIRLDLAQDRPTHETGGTSGIPRWLSLSGVLRKIRKRLEALEAGESPESLKLGSGISSEASTALLKTLADNLKRPQASEAGPLPGGATASVVVGLDAIYRQLGGKSLKAPAEPTSVNRRAQDQIALFGHMVDNTAEQNAAPPQEAWLLMPALASVVLAPAPDSVVTAEDSPGALRLSRPAGGGEARLSNKSLLAVRLPEARSFALAAVSSLYARGDGSLHAVVQLFPGDPQPLVAQVRERPMGKVSHQPALMLPAAAAVGSPLSVVLPAGLPARALSVSLLQEQPLALRLAACLERGGDYERWSCVSSPP